MNKTQLIRLKSLLPLTLCFAFIGCASSGVSMKRVLAACEQYQAFENYVSCVKNTYSSNGLQPNAIEVKTFYAHLEVISEALLDRRITNSEARLNAYRAYLEVIEPAVQRNQAAAYEYLQGLNEQLRQQQEAKKRKPILTTCTRNNVVVNCLTQ